MSPAWIAEMGRLGGLIAAALVLGSLLGYPSLLLWLTVLAYLGWHLWHLYRLEAWLRQGTSYFPPEAEGIWGEVLHHIYRVRRRNQRRKRRVAALMREFREATTAMPDGTVILDAEGTILWYNDAAAEFLGLVTASDVGQRVENLVRAPAFVEYLESGEYDRAVELPSPVHPARHLSLQIVPYGSGQRLLLVKDVTQLARLERTRRDFVANASHELRSPLTVVSGYLEAMQDDPGSQENWGPQLAEMQRQTERTVGIVEDLLELSRLESIGGEAGLSAVDVPSLLQTIRQDAAEHLRPGQSIELCLESDAGLAGSEKELYSAFNNLVDNAMAYSPEGGRIRIRWQADECGARLSVEDEGVGVAAEHIPRLTERFYRVDAGRSRAEGGSGLGLAIVKHVLQRHGGRLEIRSELGRGSSFVCHLPQARVLHPDTGRSSSRNREGSSSPHASGGRPGDE